MIKSFKNKELKKLFLAGDLGDINPKYVQKIRRVLAILAEITDVLDINFSSYELFQLKSKTINTITQKIDMEMYNPPHPGEILLEEYIKPLGFSISSFSEKIGTSRKNLSQIVNQKVGISSEMALKLAKALGTSSEIWLKLQMKYDLWNAKQVTNLDSVQVLYKKR